MSRGRKVRPEERALWDKVAARTDRLEGQKTFDMSAIMPVPVNPRPLSDAADRVMRAFPKRKQPVSSQVLPGSGDHVAMDKRAFTNLKRGKLEPEAKIDLHGMTLDRAHPELIRFILSSHARALRLVLVITGKGKARDEGGPIPVQHGVLRHHVPQWLQMPPLRSTVLQIAPAHRKHGGEGAFYVYLRRTR